MIGAGVFGDHDLLKRSAVALEQAGDGGEEPDRDHDRQRGGGDSRDDTGRASVGLAFMAGSLRLLGKSGVAGTYFPTDIPLQSFSRA